MPVPLSNASLAHTDAGTAPTLKTWTRDGFLISTDPSLIPIPALTQAFDSDQLYWAKALSEPAMRKMLDNSLCFGLYSPTPSPPPAADPVSTTDATDPADTLHEIATSVQKSQKSAGVDQGSLQGEEEASLIGFARAITDRVTFAYLTDVYVLPDWQGRGLGSWLVGCAQELLEEMPQLRRSMCIVGHDAETRMQFYRRLMKMEPLDKPAVVLTWRGPGCSF